MDAVFTSPDDYLAELKAVAAAQPRTMSALRMTVERIDLSMVQDKEPQSGMQYVVVTGFHDDRYFYQGMFDCGIARGRNDMNTPAEAVEIVERIRRTCEELNVELRGGQWLRP